MPTPLMRFDRLTPVSSTGQALSGLPTTTPTAHPAQMVRQAHHERRPTALHRAIVPKAGFEPARGLRPNGF